MYSLNRFKYHDQYGRSVPSVDDRLDHAARRAMIFHLFLHNNSILAIFLFVIAIAKLQIKH
jgi:predicted transcriptional regulator